MALEKRFIASFITVLALIATLALALCACPPSAHADENESAASGLQGAWHTWRPNPGDTIDISGASANTTIQIDKAGEYRLTGKSTNVRVVISPSEGQTITVKLANGLNIDPSITSNVGVRTAAIEIGESKGATVKLVSEPGAETYFGSYLLCPAIRKEGTQTKLVLETEDPSNPGTIKAHASPSSNSAGIGSVYVLQPIPSRLGVTGNIEINSGYVVADGGSDAAGIGGGARQAAKGITINGGTVEATGLDGGAGIGGGLSCSGKNITINGGTVVAKSAGTGDLAGTGAGIGGGYKGSKYAEDDPCSENIRINGGDVTAYSTGDRNGNGGSGIGAGQGAWARSIYITGGTVSAQGAGRGSGIGAGGDSSATDIYISGGNVTAIGGTFEDFGEPKSSAGIGGNFWWKYTGVGKRTSYPMNIVISGGVVNATGAVGIGSSVNWDAYWDGLDPTWDGKYSDTKVTISGGTVTASSTLSSPGTAIGNVNDMGNCTTTITGGSVQATVLANGSTSAGKVSGAVNKWGEAVSKTTVTIDGATNVTRITDLDQIGTAHADTPYGMKDVYTSGNRLYPWIHSGNSVTSAVDSSDAIYTGKVAAGKSETLSNGPNVELRANGTSSAAGYTDGTAYARSYVTSLSSIVPPTTPGKLILAGYGTTADPNAADAKLVANADGSLMSSVEGYTDDNGRWIHQMNSSGKATLYAWWDEPAYTIAFDANVPATASTRASGSMDVVTAKVGQSVVLQTCGFSLPGYTFTRWNTKADGSGTFYADDASVEGLAQDDGATVTLYAQWVPLSYSIELIVDNGQTQEIQTISAEFDEQVELQWSGTIPDNKTIVGWSGHALGSFYAYGSKVANLCGLNGDGTLSNTTVYLSAVVAEKGMAYLTITDDGEPVTLNDPSTQISLEDEHETTFNPNWTNLGSGVYATPGGALATGTYTVSIDGWDTRGATIEITDGAGMLSLAYFTVEVASDDHAQAWIADPSSGDPVQRVGKRLAGDTVEIGASVESGYSFESWTAGGIGPAVWDPSAANQTITLTGPVALQAHPAANVYQVNFDPNADDATGSMSAQDMVYGEPQNLFANGFSRDGYDFAGWTTTPSWEGTLYADGENVQDLATKNGAVVTLYAQWNPHAYYVHFDPNGADTVDAGVALDQKFFHGISQELLPCVFNLEGFHFLGWNTEADGSGTQFADKATVSENLSDIDGGSVTLYAQWERDYYTVLFDANGGTGAMDPQKVEIGMGEPLDTCQFVREGYEFVGWNTAPDGSGAGYQSGVALEEDLAAAGGQVTLYAQWNEEPESGQINPDDDPNDDPNGDASQDQDKLAASHAQEKLAQTGDSATGVFSALAALAVAACIAAAGAWRRARR